MSSRTVSVGAALAVGTVLAGAAIAHAQGGSTVDSSLPAAETSTAPAWLTHPDARPVVVTVVKKVRVKPKVVAVAPAGPANAPLAAPATSSSTSPGRATQDRAAERDETPTSGTREHEGDEADEDAAEHHGDDHDEDHGDDHGDDGDEPGDD